VWQTVPLLSDRPYYDARTTLGSSLLAIGPAWSPETARWLRPLVVGDLDGNDRRWEAVIAQGAIPDAMFTRGLWWFGYYPRVASDSGTVKQYFTALPAPLVKDTDQPGFHPDFHDALVDYALYDLWAQVGESALALRAWKDYAESEQDLTNFTQGRGGTVRVPGLAASGTYAR
jgi:hypothetical protein